MTSDGATGGGVGSRAPLLDAEAFVTGSARYTTDLSMPGMLHCVLRYSEVPHARIVRIDVEAARSLPGVVDVITGADVPDSFNARIGLCVADRRLLAADRVRSVADVVAAVAAVDAATAARAAALVEVEYEELPGVFSVDDALADGAPLVHDDPSGYVTAEYIAPHHVKAPGNTSTDMHLRNGDVDAGRQVSAFLLRERFSTQRIEHFHMEPHAALASYDAGTGRMTMWSSIGKPFRIAAHLAMVLRVPMSHLHVVTPAVGGDFGGKGEVSIEPYCGLFAMRTGRPVKAVFTREEEFFASTCKVPFEIDMEIGIDADGLLQCMVADVKLDAGPYNGLSSMVGIHATTHLEGPYVVPNLDVRARTIYTNNIVSGAFRGFGAPQITFARESVLDELARQAGIDALELRLRNAWEAGVTNGTGQHLDSDNYSVAIKDTLSGAAPHLARARTWKSEAPDGRRRRGVGVSAAHQGLGGGIWTGADTTSAILKVELDGSVSLNVGVADVGQGTSTALRQILATELSIPVEAVGLTLTKDTHVVPFHGGASASRQLFTSGNATHLAGRSMHTLLRKIAGDMLEVSPEDLELVDGRVQVRGLPPEARSFSEIAYFATHKLGDQPMVREAYSAPIRMLDRNLKGAPFQTFDYATQIAEVEVDVDTGGVSVRRLVTVQDVGKAINPTIVEGQIDGSVSQGIGYALLEQIEMDGGHVTNPFAFDYRIPQVTDMPELESVILEHPDPRGPHGAKGAGEAAIVPAAAAITNAIRDAVGVRIRALPATPERVHSALADAADEETAAPAGSDR